MNLVARDDQTQTNVKNNIAKVFPKVIIGSDKEDINEVVICPLYIPKKFEQFEERVWIQDKDQRKNAMKT
uniref:Uncharacterized protein n=1 Tax=Acrobeloides nanus TaxID=290746 RepID=A0A914DWW0_9BILA